MKNILFPLCLCLCFIQSALGQYISSVTLPDTSVILHSDTSEARIKYAQTILGDHIKKHLYILASDEYEGRETGQKGNAMAADYIANHFKAIGLKPGGLENSYFQNVIFTSAGWDNTEMFVNDTRYKHLWDYLAFPSLNDDIASIDASEVLFLGYGIEDEKYNDYKNIDVSNKVLLINAGEPVNKDSVSYITGTKELSDWSLNINKKLELANNKGAKLVLLVTPDLKDFLYENRRYFLNPRLRLGDLRSTNKTVSNHVYISSKIAESIIGSKKKKIIKARKKIKKKGKSKSIALPTKYNLALDKYEKILEGDNVLGLIEGTDKKDEVIVVSGHYDHLGKKGDEIFNGADDNGSGTSTILDIAEAFAAAKDAGFAPRRTILFLLVTGEEKGLLGSEWYAEYPAFDLDQHVANVNVDMIGRVDEKYADNPNYIYVIGSDRLSSDMHQINEEVNQKYAQLTLDYTYNSESDPNRYYYRSDHYNFARKGIPAIFFFSGVHEDYHQPTDTPDKIMYEKAAKVGRLIFQNIWELANRNDRIIVDGK